MTVAGKSGVDVPTGTLKISGSNLNWSPKRMQYTVIIEKEPGTGWGAYAPDLPGCIAAADSREEVEQLIREAIEFHIQGLREDGDPIPQPSSSAILVNVAA